MNTLDNLDSFTRAYIQAALWSSTTDNDTPLDRDYSASDIAPETLAVMIAECAAFQAANAEIITDDSLTHPHTPSREHEGEYTSDERAGHDFWLTRNHHGCGFWDGDWVKPFDKQLTDSAHAMGEVNLYVGDDGRIYA